MAQQKKSGWLYWVRKILRVLLLLALGLAVLGLLGLEGLDRYLSTDRGARWIYRKTPEPIAVHYTDSGLRYIEIGDPEKPALMLLHGSPGSIMDWRGFARDPAVYDQYRLLIPERPGYGGSKPRKAEPSVREQARRCLEVLSGEGVPTVVAGYSYGAPVGLAMAGMAPDKVARFVGVAGQYNPDEEMTLPISYMIRFGIFRYMLPRWLWVSNVEKLGHPAALREAMPLFDQANVPIDLIHGLPDAIVPYGNSPWLEKRLGERVRVHSVAQVGHEMPFSSMDTIVQFVLRPERFFGE